MSDVTRVAVLSAPGLGACADQTASAGNPVLGPACFSICDEHGFRHRSERPVPAGAMFVDRTRQPCRAAASIRSRAARLRPMSAPVHSFEQMTTDLSLQTKA